MHKKKINDLELYQMGFEIQEIGNNAVEKAIKETKQQGIPVVFSQNGVIYYELPSGEITTKNPFDKFSILKELQQDD